MKKYLYCFIIIISIIIMVVLGIIFKNKQLSIATNNESNVLDKNLLESENIVETEEQEEIQQNEEIREEQNNQEENKQQQPITESTNNKVITTNNKVKETQKNPITTKNTSNSQSNINQTKTQEEQKPVNNKQETTTQAQTQSTKAQTKEEGEKFIRNDTMINKIKSVIDNNKSDNMKTYGYTIQVDSSIKSKTNQFTFAESRVINLIKYSFGTIRIYAEDYYNNGQFIMTECYIF